MSKTVQQQIVRIPVKYYFVSFFRNQIKFGKKTSAKGEKELQFRKKKSSKDE